MMFIAYRKLRIRTENVRVEAGEWVSDELGIVVPLSSCESARAHGLVGDFRYVVVGTMRIPDLVTPQYRSRRLPAGIAPALIRSITHNAKGMGVEAAAIGALFTLGIAFAQGAFLALSAMLALFVLSILIHEAGHVLAYRIAGGPELPGYLVRKGAQSHLIRLVLSPRADRFVTVAGPFAPFVATVLLFPSLWLCPIPYFAWAAISLGHLVMLAAPVGDGANLRDSFRNRGQLTPAA